MGQPERRASSTRRAPSTPTKPDSVGRPPRSAMRNSLSQRLSRLVRSAADSPSLRTLRAALPGLAIAWRLANFVQWALTQEQLCWEEKRQQGCRTPHVHLEGGGKQVNQIR